MEGMFGRSIALVAAGSLLAVGMAGIASASPAALLAAVTGILGGLLGGLPVPPLPLPVPPLPAG